MLVALAVAFAAEAAAQSVPGVSSGGSDSQVRTFWTAARLKGAKPLALDPDLAKATVQPVAPPPAQRASGPGSPPLVDAPPAADELFQPDRRAQAGLGPPATDDSVGALFTTSRVFPDAATTTYPFRAVGKLFFHDPGSGEDFVCSGAVLRPRLVVTAGHCVYHAAPGSADDHFYSNWLFVPAYRNGAAPYCAWTTTYRIVAPEWFGGDGTLPNAGDVAILEVADKPCTPGSPPQKIGALTGWYGYSTFDLLPQSVTQIGYSANLDGGQRQEVTWAPSHAAIAPESVVIGSTQGAGAAGGPWLKNFGVQAIGQTTAPETRNQLVSVTSFGAAPGRSLAGGSILGAGFATILRTACNHRPGNC
jgi:hypothetical protein